MKSHLQALWDVGRLPEGWSEPSLVEDTAIADGLELHRAGVSSTSPDEEEIVGAAADAVDGASPLPRAYFELLERAATLEAIRERQASRDVFDAQGRVLGRCAGGELFP